MFHLFLLMLFSSLVARAQSVRPGMGSIPYDGGVTFRVWAPFASSVAVRGEFNSWGETPLISEGNGHWSVDIAGASAGQQYKYFLNGDTWRRDPRGRMISWADDNSIIYDVDAFDWGEVSDPMPWRNDLVIYQMHVGTFEGGSVPRSLDDAVTRLDHLENLGISAIKLMPVNEFPGMLSWGYNPIDLFAIERDYGGADALKRFVKACHERDIAVIMDVVHNHYGPTDLDIWRFDGWYENNLGGIYFYNDDRAHTPWGSTRPDFGRSEVRDFIRDQIMMFVEEYRIGGFRWDSVYNIINTDLGANPQGRDMLEVINWELSQSYPHVIRGAEDHAFDYDVHFENQWDVGYRWDLHAQVTTADDGNRNMNTVAGILQNWAGHHRVVFSEAHDYIALNHDRSRLPTEIDSGDPYSIWARKRALLAAGIVMTTPGIPMIFQGQEMHETFAFHDDTPLRWNHTNTYAGIVRAYTDLIHARRNLRGGLQGLKGTGINVHHIDNNNKVIAYIRWDAGGQTDDVVVVANFANTRWTNENYEIVFPSAGTWYSHFNSDSSVYQSDFDNIGFLEVEAAGDPVRASVNMGRYSLQIFSKEEPGEAPPPPEPSYVTFDPPEPSGCVPVTITYYAGDDVLHSADPVYIHIGRNGWQDVIEPNPAMTSLGDGGWEYTYDVPSDTYEINMAFNDGAGTWDNNNGQDWHLDIADCGEPPSDPSVTFEPAEPSGCDPVNIVFDPGNGILQGASPVYIFIGRNGWQDIIDPNPEMSSLGDGRWEYEYDTPYDTHEINVAFHDGEGNWENNDGQDWSVSVENCGPGPATAIVFITPEQAKGVGELSDLITVELRDTYGNTATSDGDTAIDLVSNYSGTFMDASGSDVITQVSIADGQAQASFRYTSTTAGEHLLTAGHAQLIDGTQKLTVNEQAVFIYNETGTFTVPEGVTNITIEAWGGGGGPRNDGTQRRGAGGGGAYARAVLVVTPEQTYDVVVGQGGSIFHEGETGNPGGDSYFGDGSQLLARGGRGGTDNGGAGGSAAESVGDVRFSGGTGGDRGQFTGGAGGGSAFADADGQDGENGGPRNSTAQGGAGTGYGGDGGANTYAGQPGQAPGGGGGARGTNGGNGGQGADGRVTITYDIPLNDPWTMDSNSDGIPDGWYLKYGLDPHDPHIADEDSDGDGFTNRQEYIAGTDPTDPESYFPPFEVISVGENEWEIRIPSTVLDRLYTIYQRTNLLEGSWTPLKDNMPGTDGGSVSLITTNYVDLIYIRAGVRLAD